MVESNRVDILIHVCEPAECQDGKEAIVAIYYVGTNIMQRFGCARIPKSKFYRRCDYVLKGWINFLMLGLKMLHIFNRSSRTHPFSVTGAKYWTPHRTKAYTRLQVEAEELSTLRIK